MKEKFQSFGKAMLVPITLIAISGLFWVSVAFLRPN